MSADELPAILGGPATFPEGFSPWPPKDGAVEEALRAAYLDGDWGRYHGERVTQLEVALSEFHDVEHALTCASGTFAIETALRALGVGPGDEVIMAGYDYEPTFLVVHALGAKPVLVDVEPEGCGLDVKQVSRAVGPLTKAVIASHLHGGMSRLQELIDVATDRHVGVVEDASQATGASIDGRMAGSWGDIGIVSFGGTKLLTAGRGGAVMTNRADLHQRLRLALHRGTQRLAPLSELQAAVLMPQLAMLPERNRLRAESVAELVSQIADIPGLTAFSAPDGTLPAYYRLGFWFDPDGFGLARDQFVTAMRAEGVAFDVGFRGLHLGRGSSRFRAIGALPVASRASEQVVGLHHPVLGARSDAVAAVARAVGKVYRDREMILTAAN